MIPETYAIQKIKYNMPRLPLTGCIDLTYRCNNNCRHCWLWVENSSEEAKKELTFDEIRRFADDARSMGCQRWKISGGEPMIRPDFIDIFDYLTSRCRSYGLSTNGTLITPKIARLMKRKGTKWIALYGATKEVYERITRNPGSFEAAMRGFRYLKEEEAGFIVQIMPMKGNYHQLKEMVDLALSLSEYYRVGAPWLYLSANADRERNDEIKRQRLDPKDVIEVDKPDLSYVSSEGEGESVCHGSAENGSNHSFFSCVNRGNGFHIDPYAQMSFCGVVRDPELRSDLRYKNFKECWKSMPSLIKKIEVTEEYKNGCGSCDLRNNCHCCPAHGYLEHRRPQAKVEYLCDIAKQRKKFSDNWIRDHRRYFNIADICIQVDSDVPFNEDTLDPKFKFFKTDEPGEDIIKIRHHFYIPELRSRDLGEKVCFVPPRAIYKKDNSWIYIYSRIDPFSNHEYVYRAMVCNKEHTRVKIYNEEDRKFTRGNLNSLTMLSTDQILLARTLADKDGCYLHSCGVDFEGKGLLFAGHSDAGKTTLAEIFKNQAKILCDDRMIIRKHSGDFKIHGTWSHGDLADVSGDSAPLRAILFIEKSTDNGLMLIREKREVIKKLLPCIIKPFVTVDWWEKSLSFIEEISDQIPCFVLRFNKSDEVVDILKRNILNTDRECVECR
ncbi:radical SAM protein [Candidatus Omnitrophota bacterium]